VEHLFESFQFPATFIAKNAVLSSFALGRQTSVVLDIGYDGSTGTLSLSLLNLLR
jgi:actin-like protein 6A